MRVKESKVEARDSARASTMWTFVDVWVSVYMRDIRFGQFLILFNRYLQDEEKIPDPWNIRDEAWPEIMERFYDKYVRTQTDNTERGY